jgi:hypothetical protein
LSANKPQPALKIKQKVAPGSHRPLSRLFAHSRLMHFNFDPAVRELANGRKVLV